MFYACFIILLHMWHWLLLQDYNLYIWNFISEKTSIEYQNDDDDDDDRLYIFVLYKFIYGRSTYVYLLVLNTLCYFLVEDGNVFWSFNELNLKKRFKKV